MMSQNKDGGKFEAVEEAFRELQGLIGVAFEKKEELHVLERGVFRKVLEIGLAAVKMFVAMHGTGDVGPAYAPAGGKELARQPRTKCREYESVFGTLEIERTVYTRGNKQRELAPLDAMLALPEGKFSYFLQDLAQMLGVDLAWEKDREVLDRLLGRSIPVDSLERMSRHMAEGMFEYQEQREFPAANQEGDLFVASGDGKGIPMRKERPLDEPASCRLLPASQRGPLPGRKQMSMVGTLYSVDRFVRTPEDVLRALFREDPAAGEGPALPEKLRPRPVGKHVWAALDEEVLDEDGAPFTYSAAHATFGWLADEHRLRDPRRRRPLVRLMDGEQRLWETADVYLPLGGHPADADILDVLHVSQHLWKVAGVFEAHRKRQETFLREQLGRVLHGGVRGVIQGLRSLATRRKLRGTARKTVDAVCGYFERNAGRMQYDDYLKKGYPIASGAIEGACRHLVKDRLERTGMRWVRDGAQAMLDLRSAWLNDEWDAYQTHYVEREIQRLHPDRHSLIIPKLTQTP
jgi:hypothetical protein